MPAARKSTARKSTARKSTARKSTARKSTARKSTARKSTARKSTARKSTARKSTARKSTARKSTARKSTARKSTARKSTARKSTARKSTARKSTARKSTARKSTARKSTARKSTARKSTARKSTARKSTARKSTARKSSRATASPIDIVRRGYQAFAEADTRWLNEHLTDDIVWHVPGRNPLSGDYRGKDKVLAFFALTMKITGATFRIELHDVVGNDDHVVALGTQFAQGPEGEFFEGRFTQVFHLRNEKASEVWTHPEDSTATDDFFSTIIREEIVLVPDITVEDVTVIET